MSEDNTDILQKLEDSVSELDMDMHKPVDNLDPDQQKFCLMWINSPMDEFEVAERMNLSDHMRRKWKKDEDVQKYIKYLQYKKEDKDFLELQKRQTQSIRKMIYQEIMGRLHYDPDKIDQYFPEGATDKQKKEFRQRFLAFADFKTVMKVWDKLEKQSRADEGESRDKVDDDKIVKQMMENFHEYYDKRKQVKVGEEVEVEGTEDIDEFAQKIGEAKEVEDANYEEVQESDEEKSSESEEDKDSKLNSDPLEDFRV